MRTLWALVTLAVLGLLASGPFYAQPAMAAASSANAGPDNTAVTRKLPDGLSRSDWAGIQKAHSLERHRVAPLVGQAGVWQARNPGQAWRTYFDGRGFRVEPDTGAWTWGLELSRYGIADEQHEVGGEAQVTTDATRVSYAWGAELEEWFVNDTRGLEHGFTLRERPGSGTGPLTLDLTVRGGLQPVALPSGRSVTFVDARGMAVVTYAGLMVLDADGHELSARLEVEDTALKVVVADQGARYPVTIDPVAQQAYLKATNTGAGDEFGYSVAVSGDTVVVLGRLPMRVERANLSSKGIWYRMQLGVFRSAVEAERLCRELARAGHSDCMVIQRHVPPSDRPPAKPRDHEARAAQTPQAT